MQLPIVLSQINLDAFDKFTMASDNFNDVFNSMMEENVHGQTEVEDQVNDEVIIEDCRE